MNFGMAPGGMRVSKCETDRATQISRAFPPYIATVPVQL